MTPKSQTLRVYYGLFANVANYSGAGYGVAVNYFKQYKSQVEHIFNAIEKLYVETCNNRGFKFAA